MDAAGASAQVFVSGSHMGGARSGSFGAFFPEARCACGVWCVSAGCLTRAEEFTAGRRSSRHRLPLDARRGGTVPALLDGRRAGSLRVWCNFERKLPKARGRRAARSRRRLARGACRGWPAGARRISRACRPAAGWAVGAMQLAGQPGLRAVQRAEQVRQPYTGARRGGNRERFQRWLQAQRAGCVNFAESHTSKFRMSSPRC